MSRSSIPSSNSDVPQKSWELQKRVFCSSWRFANEFFQYYLVQILVKNLWAKQWDHQCTLHQALSLPHNFGHYLKWDLRIVSHSKTISMVHLVAQGQNPKYHLEVSLEYYELIEIVTNLSFTGSDFWIDVLVYFPILTAFLKFRRRILKESRKYTEENNFCNISNLTLWSSWIRINANLMLCSMIPNQFLLQKWVATT